MTSLDPTDLVFAFFCTRMPKVSIITPAFNASRFIAETVASVQHQTIKDWEMLIADDCSTDETRDIVARITANDRRIKLLPLSEHAGVAGCRNGALSEARGRFIAFLDSDDLWMPPKLEAQIAFMEANDAALSYTQFRRISEDGIRVGRLVTAPPRMSYQQLLANTAIATVTAMVDSEKTGALRMREAPRDD
ncbi:MAG TPA: glycosyltransferase family 2 protein, partial [Hyphomicrobiales bacterium]|nr:glycosyltransferase family 2 protein [Hyphomicrobiales bacterium]